jgi:hypothetical protein
MPYADRATQLAYLARYRPAYYAKHRAQGICPGCHFDHDGSAHVFCFECRLEQSEKAKRWQRKRKRAVIALNGGQE